MIQASWERSWNELAEFFNYPGEVRRTIYTTNAIESLNFSLRNVTRNKSSFPDDESICKVMYLVIKNASARWTMPIKDWGAGRQPVRHPFRGAPSALIYLPFTQFL